MSWPPFGFPPPWLYPRDGIDPDPDESNQLNTLGLGLRVGMASLTRATSADLTNGFGTSLSKFTDAVDVDLAQLHRLGKTGVKLSGTVDITYEHDLSYDKTHDDRDIGSPNCIFTLVEHREESLSPSTMTINFEARQLQPPSYDLLRNLGLGRKAGESIIPGLHTILRSYSDADSEAGDFQAPVDISMTTTIAQTQSALSCSGSCTPNDELDLDETVNGRLWLTTIDSRGGGTFTDIEIRFGLVDGSPKLALFGQISLFSEFDTAVDLRATPLVRQTKLVLYTGEWSTVSGLFPGVTSSSEISAGTFLGVAIKARTLLVDQDFAQSYEHGSLSPVARLSCVNSSTGLPHYYEKLDQTGSVHLEATAISLSDSDL